jgi:hypothetical protein
MSMPAFKREYRANIRVCRVKERRGEMAKNEPITMNSVLLIMFVVPNRMGVKLSL